MSLDTHTEEIYNEIIKYHAFLWLKDYAHLSSIIYLENNAGPVLGYYINRFGISSTVSDLDRKIQEIIG